MSVALVLDSSSFLHCSVVSSLSFGVSSRSAPDDSLSRGGKSRAVCVYRNKREREKERRLEDVWRNDGSVLVGVFEDDRYEEF